MFQSYLNGNFALERPLWALERPLGALGNATFHLGNSIYHSRTLGFVVYALVYGDYNYRALQYEAVFRIILKLAMMFCFFLAPVASVPVSKNSVGLNVNLPSELIRLGFGGGVFTVTLEASKRFIMDFEVIVSLLGITEGLAPQGYARRGTAFFSHPNVGRWPVTFPLYVVWSLISAVMIGQVPKAYFVILDGDHG